ncbi:MAG: glucosaminidase domain-containing protein [Ferruginibacter sp.]
MIILKTNAFWLIVVLFFLPRLIYGQSKYVKTYKPVADSLSRLYGIPSVLILGVAIVESGSGTSRNSKMLNNHFGISGRNNLLKKRGIKTRYKQYANARYSFAHFAKHLTKRKFYKRLKGNMNYILWVDAISKDGYSEKPSIWKRRVLSTIKKNKLTSLQ